MSEIKASYIANPDTTANLERLIALMNEDYVALLAQLLEEVKAHRYGAIEIIVAEGAIQSIKSVKSYQSRKVVAPHS